MTEPSISSQDRPALVWFTRDLRLADQPALTEAAATGRPLLACYIHDPKLGGVWAQGAASRWWLHQSLQSLATDLGRLGVKLILRQGETAAVLHALVRESRAASVHAAHALEPAGRAVLAALAPRLAAEACALNLHWTTVLADPASLRSKTGSPYFVFTPFSRACADLAAATPPLPPPTRLRPGPDLPSNTLASWRLLPTRPDWAGGLRETWRPGEAAAEAMLARFIESSVESYADQRNLPGIEGVSRLSPYLHFGEISAHSCRHAALARPGKGSTSFINEIYWREFSAHLLWHNPRMPDAPLRESFAAMRWRNDPAALAAWQRGQTGIPIVDAGMRQLWHTGWQHNRVRMITASFLIKHLLINWCEGEAWFWDTLVDADLASNSASWQWVAGSGADAAPFFRIFNPELQGRKFDPDGTYVKRWVPELARLPASVIHAPWEAPALVLREAGVSLGRTYPEPLVDLGEARARALDAFRLVTAKVDHAAAEKPRRAQRA